jgi:hypothetical protein
MLDANACLTPRGVTATLRVSAIRSHLCLRHRLLDLTAPPAAAIGR